MPQISRFFGITISMYYRDHNPPHFHAEYNWEEVAINIENFGISEWKISPKALSLVIERASCHKQELLDNRNIMKINWIIHKIPPLE